MLHYKYIDILSFMKILFTQHDSGVSMNIQAPNVVININSTGPQAVATPIPPEPGRLFSKDELFDPHIEAAFLRWWRGGPPEVAASMPITKCIPGLECESSQPSDLAPFDQETRDLLIYENRILVCGVELWRECADTSLRDALALLSSMSKDGFVRLRGAKLDRDLGRSVSNPVSKLLERFCKRGSTLLESQRGLACGRYDILDSRGGGFHFTRWMRVKVIGDWARALDIEPWTEDSPPAPTPANDGLNERQRWLVDELTNGAQLTQKDVLFHFRNKLNASTIKRDLKALRERGLLGTDDAGYYRLLVAECSC